MSGPALRIGLTGGIGSGKSTVAALLATRGATVLDADACSRASTAPGGRAMPDIRRVFGDAFVGPDGGLNRPLMRERVFADPQAKAKLEAIVHPHVHQTLQEQLKAMSGGCAVFDVPLLVESGHWRERVHTVWVVDCDTPTQVDRVIARNGWPRQTVLDVIAAQASRTQRLQAADAVLFNGQGKTLEQIQVDVYQLACAFGL